MIKKAIIINVVKIKLAFYILLIRTEIITIVRIFYVFFEVYLLHSPLKKFQVHPYQGHMGTYISRMCACLREMSWSFLRILLRLYACFGEINTKNEKKNFKYGNIAQ